MKGRRNVKQSDFVRGVKEAADYAAALREQNEMLKKQNERLDTLNKQLRKRMTTTDAREVNRKAIKDLSRKLLKNYGSSMKLSELYRQIKGKRLHKCCKRAGHSLYKLPHMCHTITV